MTSSSTESRILVLPKSFVMVKIGGSGKQMGWDELGLIMN